jgi:hypothetical protein
VAANDFVFVAGNMAFRPDGTQDPKVYVGPGRNWGGETAFRRQVRHHRSTGAVIEGRRLGARTQPQGSGLYGRLPHPFACVQVPGPMPPSGAVAIGDFWVYAG